MEYLTSLKDLQYLEIQCALIKNSDVACLVSYIPQIECNSDYDLDDIIFRNDHVLSRYREFCGLISGQNRLGDNIYTTKLNESPDCVCGKDKENAEHVMMNCIEYDSAREKLMEKIEQIFRKNDIKQDRRGNYTDNILHPDFGGTAESQMRRVVLDFIKETKIKL